MISGPRWPKSIKYTVSFAFTNLVCSWTKSESQVVCWAATGNTVCIHWMPEPRTSMTRTKQQLLCLRGGAFAEKFKNIYGRLFSSSIYDLLSARKRPRRSPAIFELHQSELPQEPAYPPLPQRPIDSENEEPLDPHSFEYDVTVWALRLPALHVSAARQHFKDRVLRRPKLKPVIVDPDDPAMRILLLNTDSTPQVI